MDHWAYRTDDDECPEKESAPASVTKLHHLHLAQFSAESSSGGSTTPCAVTNAPGDPSWWQFTTDPERAQPLPSTFQHKQPPGCAPDFEEGELLPPGDDGADQDPRLPPGVVDIAEELRWKHREKQRLREWARSVLVKCGTISAGTETGTERRNEPPPSNAAREETTRNCRMKVFGPPSRNRNDVQQHRDRLRSWYAPRPLRQPCLEHPSDGLAGPHQGSTRHRGGVGPYHHLRKERHKTPYHPGRSYAPTADRRYQYHSGSSSAAWNFSEQRYPYERRRPPHTIHRE